MNDEQMQALLEVWFDDTDPTPPDSVTILKCSSSATFSEP